MQHFQEDKWTEYKLCIWLNWATEMIKGDHQKSFLKNTFLKLESQVQIKAWRQKHNNMQTRTLSLDTEEDSTIE